MADATITVHEEIVFDRRLTDEEEQKVRDGIDPRSIEGLTLWWRADTGLIVGHDPAWEALRPQAKLDDIIRIDINPIPGTLQAAMYGALQTKHPQSPAYAMPDEPEFVTATQMVDRVRAYLGAHTRFIIIERRLSLEIWIEPPSFPQPVWWKQSVDDIVDGLNKYMPAAMTWNLMYTHDVLQQLGWARKDESVLRVHEYLPERQPMVAARDEDPPPPLKPRSAAGPGGSCYDCGKRGGHIPGCPLHRATPMPPAEDDDPMDFDDVVDRRRTGLQGKDAKVVFRDSSGKEHHLEGVIGSFVLSCGSFTQNPDSSSEICWRCGCLKEEHSA